MELSINTSPSLYVHFPFCKIRCAYCDFYSCGMDSYRNREIFPDYIKKINLQHKVLCHEYGIDRFSSLYIGGGTPSLIPLVLLDNYSSLIDSAGGERTIEVNPESVTADLLKKYDDLGLNRISMGIQSFHDNVLSSMGRLANVKMNMRALELIEKYWIHDWSVDLIFGYPGQTGESQIKDITSLLKIKPPHFSLYTLTVEKGTPLEKTLGQHKATLPDQEEMDDCWFESLDLITKHNYNRYEISSFGLNGHCSQHNKNYWNMGQWLGLGPSAGSYMQDKQGNPFRFTGKVLDDFLNSQEYDLLSTGTYYDSEKTSELDSTKEIIMMGLRMSDGIPLERLNNRLNTDFITLISNVLAKWKGSLAIRGDHLLLTQKGMDWHSAVMIDIFFNLENHYGCHDQIL